ncbi:MAG: hypothetical protein V4597_11590 [Pseudomonadota bacterium]
MAFKATGSGSGLVGELSNLGDDRMAQLEAPGFEMGRSGRSFVGGHSLIAGAISPVSDLPTTTAPMVLFNSAPTTGNKCLVVKRLSFSYSTSGTISAFGSVLFAGVTPSKLATALVANGATNFRTQATRGTGTALGFVDVAKTIAQPTWQLLGGIVHGAETTMSIGYTVDLSSHPYVVQPQFALAFGVLSAIDTVGATTPLYILSVAWDECEATLP